MQTPIFGVFYRLFQFHLLALFSMSLFRAIFLFYYGGVEKIELYPYQTLDSLFLGMRLDLTVIGYIQAIPTLALILINFRREFIDISVKFFKLYLFLTYLIVSAFLLSDFAFFSFFKEHINITFFGIIDDDTSALLTTIWDNYPIVLALVLSSLYIYILWKSISKVISNFSNRFYLSKFKAVPYLLLILILNFLAIRGTLGMYPLGKMMPNISEDRFINSLSSNGVRSFIDAFRQRVKSQNGDIDLISQVGYSGKIEEAFRVHTGKESINREKLLQNITYRTEKREYLEKNPPNILVIMVESFGLPPIEFQSEEFNIMGSLKKHFQEDILFKNFISSGDGTIPSLESLLLNTPLRPLTLPFVETRNNRTQYSFSPAFVYKESGYETSFIYGGDLSWRDIGSFAITQNYQNIEGKFNIYKSSVEEFGESRDYFHPWGIHDEYLFNHIFKKLENSDKPQFIFALTTDNHPPYSLPKEYTPHSLKFSEDFLWSVTGDLELAKKRFLSFQYALNSLGDFLTRVKNSPLSQNTVVVVTADNHTTDGIMRYREDQILNSKRVPLYIYLPKYIKDEVGDIDNRVFGSHKDIFPTLYNLTLSNREYISIGQNLLDQKATHIGFNGSKVLVSKDENLRLRGYESNSSLAQYYRASLAVTQYLLDSFERRKSPQK